MAKNTGEGYRKGAIRNRSQTYNPQADTHVKRGDDGRFVSAKKGPYKGVRKE